MCRYWIWQEEHCCKLYFQMANSQKALSKNTRWSQVGSKVSTLLNQHPCDTVWINTELWELHKAGIYSRAATWNMEQHKGEADLVNHSIVQTEWCFEYWTKWMHSVDWLCRSWYKKKKHPMTIQSRGKNVGIYVSKNLRNVANQHFKSMLNVNISNYIDF